MYIKGSDSALRDACIIPNDFGRQNLVLCVFNCVLRPLFVLLFAHRGDLEHSSAFISAFA